MDFFIIFVIIKKYIFMLNFIKKLFGIESTDYQKLITEGGIIIDVRTKGEFASGHIKNSINIPLDNLAQNLTKLKDKNQPIITCCASGMRSRMAKNILKNKGYTQVYNGGSWHNLNNKI